MVLFGLRGLIRREQARQLLAWSVRRHWGFISLPELAQWQRGKPYFPHLPRCQFNLSHSGTLALCALSDRPVGVDIQMVRPVWRDSLIDRSCTPGERAWLRSRQDRPGGFHRPVGRQGVPGQAERGRTALPSLPAGRPSAPAGRPLQPRGGLPLPGAVPPLLLRRWLGGGRLRPGAPTPGYCLDRRKNSE